MPRETPRGLTHDELARLRELRASGATLSEIARAMGRTYGCINSAVTRYGIPLGGPPPVTPDGTGAVTPPDPVYVERQRLERLRTLREERELLSGIAGEGSLRARLEQYIAEVVPRFEPPPPYQAPRAAKEVTEESLVLCLSDWHYGEVVDAERTRGFNAFSPDICATRAQTVFDAARTVVQKLQRGGWRWNRAVVSVNGDMLTGTIHDLERHSDGANIVQSTYACHLLLSRLLRDFAALVPRLDVFFTSGNHTRMALKMEAKDPTRSWDAVLGLFVKTAIEDGERITVTVPNAYGCAFEVEGRTFVQTHGHQIKGGSFGGLPWYGINRMVTNYNALEASRGGRVTGWLLGHFHQASSIPNVSSEIFVNGSLISGTEWTIDTLGKNDRPCQWLLGVHAEHGVTHRWPLYAA